MSHMISLLLNSRGNLYGGENIAEIKSFEIEVKDDRNNRKMMNA